MRGAKAGNGDRPGAIRSAVQPKECSRTRVGSVI